MLIAILAPDCQQLDELRDTVNRLNADSDDAAETHAIAAGRLQSQLDALDVEGLDNVLLGLPAPSTAIARRRVILDELAEINRTLEQRCHRNQRAVKRVERRIDALAASDGR